MNSLMTFLLGGDVVIFTLDNLVAGAAASAGTEMSTRAEPRNPASETAG